jgi:tetratricopeptide (TPR) repeat protein
MPPEINARCARIVHDQHMSKLPDHHRVHSLAIALVLLLGALGDVRGAGAAGRTVLGTVHFPATGKPRAQKSFVRGVLLLHNFDYEDARAEFQEASRIDPGFAMAYWGEAMTHNHPLWFEQDVKAARAALARLAPTAAGQLQKAGNDRERGYLKAVQILYGEGSKPWRDEQYSIALEDLCRHYPKDLEALAFSALALLGACEGNRDTMVYMRAAAKAEEVYRHNPDHPGALHYLTHSFDEPVHAPLGLPYARAYSKVAAASAHAQHMPSHIFMPLGLWDDVSVANERAWQVSCDRVNRRKLKIEGRDYHSYHWLHYSYLQQGRFDDAGKILDGIEQAAVQSKSPRVRWYLAHTMAIDAVETDRWDRLTKAVDLDGIELSAPVSLLFARGLAAVRRGDLKTADAVVVQMKQEASQVGRLAAPAGCCRLEFFTRSWSVGTSSAESMIRQLAGLLALARGKPDQGLEQLRASIDMVKMVQVEYGPPLQPCPVYELYGDALRDLKRYDEAKDKYRLSLEERPGRSRPLLGLIQIARIQNDHATAERLLAQLDTNWKHADPAQRAHLASLRAPAPQPRPSPSPTGGR